MKRMIRAVLTVCFAAMTLYSEAQTSWQQIEQARFTVIFEAGLEDEAQRVTYLLNTYLDQHLQDFPMNAPYRPVPVVLFTDAHTSNGNVGMPPLRSHWYNKPYPLSGTEWFDTLAVHEGRHMVHYNQLFDHETGRVLTFLFGETGAAIFSGLFFPSWLYEGDAVMAETRQTAGGRGRNAAFNLWLRTDWLNNEPYRYDRAILGTGFDRMPYVSPYDLGYYIVQSWQERHGDQVVDRIMAKTGSFDAIRFTDGVFDVTGQHVESSYANTVLENQTRWQQQFDALNVSPVTTVFTNEQDHWVSWYPVSSSSEGVLAAEVDLERGAALVSIEQGVRQLKTTLPREATSRLASSAKSRNVFMADERVCYVREVPGVSVQNAQNGRLECWSAKQGFEAVIDDEKLTSATYADGQFLVHVFKPDRSSELRLYSAEGELQSHLALPVRASAYDLMPSQGGWVFVMQTDEGHGIFHVNGALTDLTLLIAADDENLRSPVLTNNWLLYTSDRSGIDQLMALSRLDGRQYQVLTRPYGSYFVTYSNTHQTITLADYTPKGQQLIRVPFSDPIEAPDDWQPVEQIPRVDWRVNARAPVQVPEALNYPVRSYSRLDNLWNLHSWYGGYDGTNIVFGVDSTDVFQAVDIDLDVGVNPATNDIRFSGLTTIRSDSGWLFGYGLQRDQFEDSSYWLNQVQAARPFVSEAGLFSQQWAPVVSAQHIRLHSGTSGTFIGAGLQASVQKDRAFQDINTPLGVSERLNAIVRVATGDVSVISETTGTIRGFTNRQSLSAALALQWVSDDDLSQLTPSTLFTESVTTSTAARGSLQYTTNLGPVGLPMTSAAYWRNTNLTLHADGQVTDEWDSAIGLSLTPRLNLFRNPNILVEPRLSVYFRPDSGTTQWAFAFLIGGQ